MIRPRLSDVPNAIMIQLQGRLNSLPLNQGVPPPQREFLSASWAAHNFKSSSEGEFVRRLIRSWARTSDQLNRRARSKRWGVGLTATILSLNEEDYFEKRMVKIAGFNDFW